jgi:hypothetical protein
VKLLIVPPLAEISLATKSVALSLNVKVSVAVWLEFKLARLLATVIVGAIVSTVSVSVLLAAVLVLPAGSLKVEPATVTTPLAVLLAVGVKVAV